ncbi:MAG: DEAD/DEAH box helicase [Nannocystaceae bacterium]
MIPSVVTTQLQGTIRDYLRTTFSLRDKSYEAALLDLLADPERGLFRGPYVDLRLPFRRGSREAAERLLRVLPSFDPHAHQLRAWERLASADQAPRSTLVATGTGSGKTECFLFPLLDHCLRQHPTKGIKAIVLYPMNALASDQAERFAREIHSWPGDGATPELRGRIRAGIYVGGKGTHPVATERHLEDMREHLRKNPPDVLLTNYRMLDFLLLRPEDGALWERNHERTLQYLVLDELHTYDGAQGTDVAFLIRRLKRRLAVPEGHLCCVGTSATIGGDDGDSRKRLLDFASDVFGEPFADDAVITEDRQEIREWLPMPSADDDAQAGEDDDDDEGEEPRPSPATATTDELSAGTYDSAADYLDAQAKLWLGPPPDGRERWVQASAADPAIADASDDDGRVALGEALRKHAFLGDLLTAQRARGHHGPRDWAEIVDALPADTDVAQREGDDRWLALASFLALVAWARRRDGGRVVPFLTLQVQLWLRELRRLLRRVPRDEREAPRFEWFDERGDEENVRYATQVYCRECGEAGFGMLKVEGKDELIDAPARVGEAFLKRTDTVRFVRVGDDPFADGQGKLLEHYLCPASLHLSHEATPRRDEPDEDGELHPIPRLRVNVDTGCGTGSVKGDYFQGICPACGAEDGLTILGSRAASLSSVALSHLFISPYNSDRKLLAFTDSVQDASHRAAFFAGRTFRFVLRTAIQAVLEDTPDDTPMSLVVDRLLEHWRSRLEGERTSVGRLAATLLPPDLRDDPDYRDYIEAIADPKRRLTAKLKRGADRLLRLRLSWEVAREFGLGVVIGRSLDRTACATAAPDPEALTQAAKNLQLWLNETRPVAMAGNERSVAEVRHFLSGLIERMRSRGAIHDRLLDEYVKQGGRFFLSRRKNPRMARFGPHSRFPLFAFHGREHKLFEPLLAPPSRLTWYRDWTARSLRLETRDGGIAEVLRQAMRRLAAAELVDTRATKGAAKTEPQASGLRPEKLLVTRDVALVGCPECGRSRTIAAASQSEWVGARCLTYRCGGQLQLTSLDGAHGYYRRLFRSGRIQRVFAAEHTGLLERTAREALEQSFKYGARPDAPNLLTCTPTLEMGIDIGDLSAVMLCSVPPLPANYMQRVGRAGRSTGNALVLTIANARPHDRYFFEAPEQMMSGHIDPPACFLDAPDMLSRQLVAFSMDAWAQRAEGEKIQRRMGDLLSGANTDGFPHSFYSYYEVHKHTILGDFIRWFGRDPKVHPAWKGIRDELQAQVLGDRVPAKIRAAFDGVEVERKRLRRQREAIKRRRAELAADPSKAYPHADEPERSAEHELQDLDDADKAYHAQLGALSGKYPLNVLTDAGVLPNYAFPEPGVTLRATILGVDPDALSGAKKDAKSDTDGKVAKKKSKRSSRARAEYIRPASAAIRELAPFNSFYAEGRRIEITQLDLGSKKAPTVERWRLCPNCSHSEQIHPESASASCPRCEDHRWADQGQERALIEFRKAWSTTTVSEASTADESDERDQKSYRVVELIEAVDGAPPAGAWLIETPSMIFGYELLPRAQLREINFGRTEDRGLATPIAGDMVEQQGFTVCALCARVQKPTPPGKIPRSDHLPWCKVRTAGAPEEFLSVGLYRHNISEAIRILLPVADHEVSEVVSSFRAAIELGFRRKFGGQPMHLRVTTMSEPSGASRQRFLVIYDTVPGGTGYLAALWRDRTLFEVMALALEAMKLCRCAKLEGRDGCYRCVYAHQHQRELNSISRRRAVALFEAILGEQGHVKEVPSLSGVNLDSLLESELERRFITALRSAAERAGWRWSETAFGGRQGFKIVVNDSLAWEIRPQVDLGPSQGVARRCRPDFVLIPVGRETRRIAVFTDGFGYHAQPDKARSRIQDDIAKRASILDPSESTAPGECHWVWSLTWTDVQTALGEGKKEGGVRGLLADVEPRTFAKLAKELVATTPGADPPRRALGGMESFDLLTRWLGDPDEAAMSRTALGLGLAALDLKMPCRDIAAESVRAALSSEVSATDMSLNADPNGTLFAGLRSASPMLALYMAIPKKRLLGRDFGALKLYLRLYDRQAERSAEGFEPAWRAFLQAWNLLQFHEVEVTSSERLMAYGEEEPSVTPAHTAAPEIVEEAVAPLRADISALLEDFKDCEALLRLLNERGLPSPEEPDDDVVVGGSPQDVDLFWEDRKVALRYGADDIDRQLFSTHGWSLFDPSEDDPSSIADAIASSMKRSQG